MSDTDTISTTPPPPRGDRFGNLLPFSPLPSRAEVRFRPESPVTYSAAPLMDEAERLYRAASLRLLYGDDPGARATTRTAVDMEDAYMARARAERAA